MDTVWKKIYTSSLRLISSQRFLMIVIALFVLQALWIALSFRFPMLYDESFHVDLAELYSYQLLPFITSQPSYYDMYGSLSHGGATLFHYVMSFPYRVVALFTDNTAALVVTLRIVNIAMVAIGLFLYSILLRKLNIKQLYINLGLLVFTLIPLTSFVAATTNYDNMLFLLTPLFLIFCVNVLKNKKINLADYAWIIIIGCVASLSKSTFLPVFAVSILFLGVYVYKKHGRLIFRRMKDSLNDLKKAHLYGLTALAIIAVGWFSSIYIYNLVAYRSLQPSCAKVMEENRCANHAGDLRNNAARAVKDKSPAMPLPDYVSLWTMHMIDWSAMTGARPNGGAAVTLRPLPVVYNLLFFSVFVGLGFLLFAWRAFKKDISWYFLVAITFSLTVIVFLQNYFTYLDLHVPYAIQPRYLLTVMPIVIVMIVMAAAFVLRKSHVSSKLIIAVLFFLVFSQGGGAVTHILKSEESWYWDNNIVIKANQTAQQVLHPLVKGEIESE